MLTEQEISTNKERFLELINSIERTGFKKDELITKLTTSDFFVAPASTQYHCNYKGGLCYHTLHVYDNLVSLSKMFYGDEPKFSDDTLKVVALLHDISKMNYYKEDYKNKKKYYEGGTKKDAGGTYDWVQENCYVVKDAAERFLYDSHEKNSEFMAATFVPLTLEERVAILHHHASQGKLQTYVESNEESAIFTKYPLATLLHAADMLSTFVQESSNE